VAESYDQFAPHFDAWQRAFGGAYDDLILPRLLAALGRHPRPLRRVADLGIGTGDLVVALARAGYEVIGVDRSAPMLAVAAEKIAAAGLTPPPVLLRQDLRALRLDPAVDAAICVYTVMNQLTDDGDLARALDAVRDALAPGGLFLFELNLPEAYDRHWSGVETMTLPDAVVRREHHRIGPLVEALVTIERADGATVRDHIAQRPYDDATMAAALAVAGYDVAGVERFNPFEPAAAALKALWAVCRSG
jgi:SAM-dependent methyltransferase